MRLTPQKRKNEKTTFPIQTVGCCSSTELELKMRFVILLFVLAVTAAAQRPPVPGSTSTCATGAEGDLLALSCGTGSVTKVAFAEFGTGTVSGIDYHCHTHKEASSFISAVN
jgi:hypothetical protein